MASTIKVRRGVLSFDQILCLLLFSWFPFIKADKLALGNTPTATIEDVTRFPLHCLVNFLFLLQPSARLKNFKLRKLVSKFTVEGCG